ncbi:MAG: AsmA family protein [Planctomycetota bacterium]|nr:AsmA family protein [Planctomycetota bacterium]
MKKPMKIGLGVLVVLALLLVGLWLSLDYIAKAGIESGGMYALGVKTSVDTVNLGLFSGQAKVSGLVIGNPEGFKSPHLMKTTRMELAVAPGSILGDTIQVNKFEIDGLDLNMEQLKIGLTNISALLDNINKSAGSGDKPKDEKAAKDAKESGGKKFKIDQIRITNCVAHIQVLPIGGAASTLEVKIPEIVLGGVTQDNAGGVAVPELMRRLVPAILAAILEKGKGVIPDADLKRLNTDVASATKALGEGAGKLVNQMGGEASKAFESIGGGFQKLGEPATKGLGDPLKGLFGGDKKKADAPKK